MNPSAAGRARALLLALALLTGCSTPATVSSPVSPARDLPDRFLVGSHTDAATSEPGPGTACRNPMVDPRDGTRLILVRAANGRGDYRVPEGRYGAGRGDLLRLACDTGKPLGLTRR